MAINDSQKTDFLWKRIGFGVTETSITGKEGFNETIPSPIPTYANDIWASADQIPSTPAAVPGVVAEYDTANAVRCTADPTVSGNFTWIATDTFGDVNTRLGDWIAPTFDPQYLIQVFDGDPNGGGSSLNQGLSGQEWVYDYIAGTLHFPNGPPSGLSEIWVVGYRYIGTKGFSALSSSGNTRIYADITARDADASVKTGDWGYVISAPDGEYAVYLALTDGPSGNWSLISTQDAAGSDAKSLETNLAFNTGASTTLGNASDGSRVVSTMVEVTTAFDGTPTLDIGVAGDSSAILADQFVDLSTPGVYQIDSNFVFTDTVDTGVVMSYTAGGATQGAANIILTFA